MRRVLIAACAYLLGSVSGFAHHGTSASYDMDYRWTTEAVVTEFRYLNPHPMLFFERKDDTGNVEKWSAELQNNPSMLARNGWTKGRSQDTLKPGAVVILTLSSSRAGGHVAVVRRLQNPGGEDILVGGPVGPQNATTNTTPRRTN